MFRYPSRASLVYSQYSTAYIKNAEMSFSVFLRNGPSKVRLTGQRLQAPPTYGRIELCSPVFRYPPNVSIASSQYSTAYIKNAEMSFSVFLRNRRSNVWSDLAPHGRAPPCHVSLFSPVAILVFPCMQHIILLVIMKIFRLKSILAEVGKILRRFGSRFRGTKLYPI